MRCDRYYPYERLRLLQHKLGDLDTAIRSLRSSLLFSLNDVLYTGATFINKIHDILVACREMPMLLIADIQAAFTQIRIQESHRDLCRFLWLRNPDKPPIHDNIIEYRWKRVPFGTTASPSMLNMVISAYLNRDGTPLANEIQRYLYVDNILLTAATPEEAVEKYKHSKELFAKIGMNLRAYVCNSSLVNSQISEADRAPYGPMKLLGLKYNPVSDHFTFHTNFESCPNTKRDILRQHHSLYDPLGFGAPLLIKQKHLMRVVLESIPTWSSKVTPELLKQWNLINKEIDKVSIEIPRHIMGQSTLTTLKSALWVFADASAQAMAVCAYVVDCNFHTVSSLLSGKTKLAPKKRNLSTPKLELLAILLALRLAESITSATQNVIEQICIASDSIIALSWIHTPRKLPLFVTNQRDRIQTILNRLTALGHEIQLLHVPGEKNPADKGTRGLIGEQLETSDWITGPQWLLDKEQRKTLTSIELIESTPMDPAEEQECANVLTVMSSHEESTHNKVVFLERFSSLHKALRVLALVCKFIGRLVNAVKKTRKTEIVLKRTAELSLAPFISASDMNHAESIMIQIEHQSLNIEDIQRRYRDKHIFLDEKGIIRVRSRLQNAELPYDTRNPIYIQPHSELMRLIIDDIHKNNGHCGKNHLLALARQRFWLVRPTRAVQQMLKRCTICQREQSRPFSAPPMAQMPPDRVKRAKTFENVGCDFFGPFLLKDDSKVYVCLYTCLTTRAIHLELVESLSGDAFLNSFIRFTSRRGVPRIVRTDCGSNFVLGRKVIDVLFERNQSSGMSTMSYCARQRITWLFNPPGAPWMGGAWERLIASVKIAYQKCIRRNKLSFVDMNTVLIRIEAIINTRPLTAVSADDTDALPLRPIDFLQGNLCFALPIRNSTPDDPTFDPNCIQTVAQAQEALEFSERIADRFWRIWNSQYLSMLREVHRSTFKPRRQNVRPVPEEGELVLIEQELIPRGRWAMGKIVQLIRSTDGTVRSAIIKLPYRQATLQRPIPKLYPLEIRSLQKETKLKTDEKREEHTDDYSNSKLAQSESWSSERGRTRTAKIKAIDAIRDHFRKNADEAAEIASFAVTHLKLNTTIAQVFLTTMLLCCVSADHVKGKIYCANGSVTIEPPDTEFELCINSACKKFNKDEPRMHFKLPASPIDAPSTVRIQTHESIDSRSCRPAPFCDHSSYILTKGLIGNPQCWPLGAMLSVAIIAYLIISLILFLIWILRHRLKQKAPSASNPTTVSLTVVQPKSDQLPAPFTLASFKPAPLTSAKQVLSTALIASAILISGSGSCQHGYMRHSVELSCTHHNECHYEFRHELIFNKATRQLCILLLHQNISVGYIKIRRKVVHLKCVKNSLFWTRETTHDIHHVTRCRGLGSCIGDACETVDPNSIVAELNDSVPSPGYTACSVQCSGINCICPIPFRACTFYRVRHTPVSQHPIEVFQCSSWQPSVKFEISIQVYNLKERKELSFLAYSSKKIGNFNLFLSSINNPHLWLNQKFALSKNESFIIPDSFIFPIECDSRENAVNKFPFCRNIHFCDCDVSGLAPSCHCPHSELSTLRQHARYLLPLSTPYTSIARSANTISAETNESETTLIIMSQQRFEGAHLNTEAPCTIQTGRLEGCYSCRQGSKIDITCHSTSFSWTTIACDHHIFPIECTPFNKTSTVRIAFDRALVSSHCFTVCGGKNVSVRLSRLLYYHASESVEDTIPYNMTTVYPQTDWFKDLRLPDLSPLWTIAVRHWKLALTIIGALTVAVLLTYVFGPIMILILFKAAAVLAVFSVKLVLIACQFCAKIITVCARGIKQLRHTNQ